MNNVFFRVVKSLFSNLYKNRLVQQDNQVCFINFLNIFFYFINIEILVKMILFCVYDVELQLKKKNKADTNNVALRISKRGQIPSIHTQPSFT